MENFIVSARKYRPVTFDTVVGQHSITSTLKNAIRNQHLAQAFLFCGPRGVGKTTCARILAKTINCQNISENIEACNKCESCLSFNKSASFNIHELDAASNNSVDDIRNLVDQVRVPPQLGKYKVYIIDEVHMLSQAAFNAFLKTLEEPPPYAKFILATTEKHKIIPTILSRCQIFDFKRITVDDIAGHLKYVAGQENVNASDDALHVIAQKADGALRDALSIFDQLVSFAGNDLSYQNVIQNLNVLDYEYYFRMTGHILHGDASSTLLTLNEIIDNGFDGQHFIIGMGEHLRNLLVCKDPATAPLLEVSDNYRKRYIDQAGLCETDFLLRALSINNQYDVNYKISNNKRLHLELSLLQMCGLMGYPVQRQAAEKKTSELPSPSDAPKAPSQVKEPLPEMTKPAQPVPQAKEKPEEDAAAEAQAPESIPEAEEQEAEQTEKKSIEAPAEEKASKYPERMIRPEDSFVTEHLSIKKASEQLNGSKEKTEDNGVEKPKRNTPFTQEILDDTWQACIEETCRHSNNLISSLTGNKPFLKDNFKVHIKLDNKVIEREFRVMLPEIHAYLRNQLENDLLTVIPSLADIKEQEDRAYFPDEIYRKMVQKNPEIKNMRDQLDLEIDF